MVMMAVASCLRIAEKVGEGHKLEKANRKRVDEMAKRACDVAFMIKVHASELSDDPVLKTSMEGIRGVVNELNEFAELCQNRIALVRFCHSGDDESKLRDFQLRIHEAIVLFLAQMAHLSHSFGPHEIIKHRDMRVFWKRRMKDEIQDVPWKNFWDHFLDEHEDIKERYFTTNLAGSKDKIERMSRTRGFVSAYDIDKLFENPTCTIEWHIQKALGSTSSHQIFHTHMLTRVQTNVLQEDHRQTNVLQEDQRLYEMQKWEGKYTIDNCPISIKANLIFLRFAHQLLGSGDDEKHGHFSCQGFLITEQDTIEASILVKCETGDRLDILFKGYIIHDCGNTRIEGNCVYPPNATEPCGTFELELKEIDILQ